MRPLVVLAALAALVAPLPARPVAALGPAATVAPQLDLNSATAAELEALPGVGKAYAARIIAGRPYTDKRQLVSKGILPEAVYRRIRERVVAKR